MTIIKRWRKWGYLLDDDHLIKIRRAKANGVKGDMIIFYFSNRKRIVTYSRTTEWSSFIDFAKKYRKDIKEVGTASYTLQCRKARRERNKQLSQKIKAYQERYKTWARGGRDE